MKISNYTILGLLNTKFANEVSKILNPTLHFQSGNFRCIPFKEEIINQEFEELAADCVSLSREEWDMHEYSMDFSQSPIISGINFQNGFENLQKMLSKSFIKLHSNEERLNQILISIYGLENELTHNILFTDITAFQDELDYEALEKLAPPYQEKLVPLRSSLIVQQFISYALGLIMGRYRLDKTGLCIAHPTAMPDEIAAYKYNDYTFPINNNTIIPLLAEDSPFQDNVVKRFKDVLIGIWGEETLTENINFLNTCLGTPFEKFLTEKFWDYHKKVYQKKPIYWLFSSAAGSFKVLV